MRKKLKKIKDLIDAGKAVEFVCINERGFLGVSGGILSSIHQALLDRDKLIYDYTDSDGDIVLVGGGLLRARELRFFEVKELDPFGDLVEEAFKAMKEGAIKEIGLEGPEFTYRVAGGEEVSVHRDRDEFQHHIDYIRSLTLETFTIESEEDVAKVKEGAEITLTNGNTMIARSAHDGPNGVSVVRQDGDEKVFEAYRLFVLKGATVTQYKI